MIHSYENLSNYADSVTSQNLMLSVHKTLPVAQKPWLYAGGFSVNHFQSLPDISSTICRAVYSPIVWKNGKRASDNYQECGFCCLDFDDGKLTVAEAQAWLQKNKFRAIIGTTKSHQIIKHSGSRSLPACDRFRIIMPFKDVIVERSVYEANIKHYMNQLPCDPSCKDAARYFFPCKEIVAIIDGEALPIIQPPPKMNNFNTYKHPNFRAFRAAKLIPRHIMRLLREGWPEGGRHSKCYHIGATLTQLGYDENEIVDLIMKSPLAAIGSQDVMRAVHNAVTKVK